MRNSGEKFVSQLRVHRLRLGLLPGVRHLDRVGHLLPDLRGRAAGDGHRPRRRGLRAALVMRNPGRQFRDLLHTEPYLFTGGVYSPLDAQIAEKVGMKSIYLSGYSMALANGWPDMGFLTQTEVTRIGALVASAVEIPVIADADDGYGNALSTI